MLGAAKLGDDWEKIGNDLCVFNMAIHGDQHGANVAHKSHKARSFSGGREKKGMRQNPVFWLSHRLLLSYL